MREMVLADIQDCSTQLTRLQELVVQCFERAMGRPPNLARAKTLTRLECQVLLNDERLQAFYHDILWGDGKFEADDLFYIPGGRQMVAGDL